MIIGYSGIQRYSNLSNGNLGILGPVGLWFYDRALPASWLTEERTLGDILS